jgi:uncharacterized RDD family membrane protein YckC
MSATGFAFEDPLYEGVLTRRVVAWLIDLVLIGVLVWVAWVGVVLIGFLTFGFGFALLAGLPAIGVLYNVLFVAGSWSATPSQMLLDLTVRHEADLGPPSLMQAILFTAGLWLTLSFAFVLLFVAPFTPRHRALHDIVAGVVVVRRKALTPGPGSMNMGVGSPPR